MSSRKGHRPSGLLGLSRRPAPLLGRGRGFRIIAGVLLCYVTVAALHGAAPQLWAHYNDVGFKNGPFRLLIFSPVIVVCLLLSIACGSSLQYVSVHAYASPQRHTVWLAWSLRGPPSHA